MEKIENCKNIAQISDKAYKMLVRLLLEDGADLSVNDVLNMLATTITMVAVATYREPIKTHADAAEARTDENIKEFIEAIIRRLKGFHSGESFWSAVNPRDIKQDQH